MPHTFPRRRYRPNETVEPDKLTEDFQNAVAKVTRLNEHDVDGADLKAKATVADGAYYAVHQAVKASSPSWRRGGGKYYALPGADVPATDPSATVEDSAGWQVLQDQGGTDTMSVDISASDEDQLFIIAQQQWCSWQYNSSGALDETLAPKYSTPLRLQFAVRLDGAVIDESIVGAALWPDAPPQQWYRATVSSASADDYDYRHIQYIQHTTGMPMAVHACRITTGATVIAGDHTVEVVARRLPPSDYKIDNDKKGNGVEVFNRRLVVIRLKGRAPHSGTATTLNIDAIQDGDTLNATTFTTDTFTALKDKVNALTDPHLSRGALRNEHLPSVIYGAKLARATDNVKLSHTGRYPGFGTNSAAWTTAGDFAGNLLTVSGPTAGEWKLADHPGVLIVTADVELTDLYYTAGPPASPAELLAIGCFAIAITDNTGTRTVYKSSEVYINSSAIDATQNPRPPVEMGVNVPLVLVINTNDLPTRITTIEVVVSTWDANAGASPTGVTAKTRRGSLLAYVIEGVSIA